MKRLVKWCLLPAVMLAGIGVAAPEKSEAHGGFSFSISSGYPGYGYGPSCGPSYGGGYYGGSPYRSSHFGYGYGGRGFGYGGYGGYGGYRGSHHHGCW
jgi:hypothetical protein